MRKSTAPSQLKKLSQRASLFSTPYKTPSSKVQENPISNQVEGSSKGATKVELLSIIKQCQTKEKENIVFQTSCSEDSKNILLTEENVEEKSVLNPECQNRKKIFPKEVPANLEGSEKETRYFSVVWCKRSNKKHKKWEGDAVLIVKGRSVTLKDMDGKEISRSSGYKMADLETLEEGNTLPVGSKEIEIQGSIAPSHYVSGKIFHNSEPVEERSIPASTRPKPKPFRLPFRNGGQERNEARGGTKPLYDVSKPGVILLPKPPAHHQWAFNTSSQPVVDVVVDPHVGETLRPHQRDGVVFLYECVTGFRLQKNRGAILADEMGLGKTLQCIALIWTLFKQGPYGGRPLLKRALIITPSSLVINWGKEFDKWLGKERLRPFLVDQQNKAEDFGKQSVSPVCVISYEMAVRSVDVLRDLRFDLLLCDEGHRLKNSQIKTTSLISSLPIGMRVVVTGTPVQNDLQELYSLMEFVNPGLLGSSSMFKKIFQEPILLSRQPTASPQEKEIGESRAAELNRLASQFTLRRTQEIINKYLPPKTEFVVFCTPTPSQSGIYSSLLGSRCLRQALMEREAGDHLSAICLLRKLCNHPGLLRANEDGTIQTQAQEEASKMLPQDFSTQVYLEEDSGKLAVVSCMLWSLRESGRERVVIVSNFTSTLDMLQQLCERYEYPFLRLDGSTPSAKRQRIVDRFNAKHCQEFVFLLSAKAGGVGLNLVGASRILLFDPDWNPATDLQAMARVWRDGQDKHVYIYRLLLAGSLEEKMYQRQVCKQGISGSVVDARTSFKIQFSSEELKDLFQFSPHVSSLTHDRLECPCDGKGGQARVLSQSPKEERDCQLSSAKTVDMSHTTMDQLYNWQHFALPQATDLLHDYHLESSSDFISFVFKNQKTQENALL